MKLFFCSKKLLTLPVIIMMSALNACGNDLVRLPSDYEMRVINGGPSFFSSLWQVFILILFLGILAVIVILVLKVLQTIKTLKEIKQDTNDINSILKN